MTKKRMLIPWQEVYELTKINRSTEWRKEQLGLFPRRIITGFNSVRWDKAEILEWLKFNNPGGTRGKNTCKNPDKPYRVKT